MAEAGATSERATDRDARRPRGRRRIRGLDPGQRQAQRRQQLLDAALGLFAAQGYANTAIEQICQTAFVGTKGFYELFDSKEACYLALLDETTGRVASQMVAALRTAPDDQDQAARALATAFAHAVTDDPRVARTTFDRGAGISPAVDRHRRDVRRWAAAFVARAWRRYGLTCASPDELQAVALGAIGGSFDLVADWLDSSGGVSRDVDALIDDLTDFHELVRAGLASRLG